METRPLNTPKKDDDLSPDQVLTWLRDHPDFIEANPDALDALVPPKDKSGGKAIADFQHYLVKRLKADRDDVLNTSRDIIETARANMNNTTRMHRAVLRLLEARSFSEFIETITSDLARELDVDIAVLVVEMDDGVIPHIHVQGIRMVPEGTVDKWLQGRDMLLQPDISGSEAIYGGAATLVRSQALVRVDINHETPVALLAFGSRDAKTFVEGQGTELITFLARVVERLFRSWLQLPLN
jgi:uncharacterized protein